MKNLKYLLLTLFGALAFVSCTEEETVKDPGILGEGVYFPATLPDVQYLEDGQNSLVIPVCRTNSLGEFTIDIQFLDKSESNIFTAAEKVRFKDGETQANYEIVFDFDDIVLGESYNLFLQFFDNDNDSPYGMPNYDFNVLYDPYETIGICTFYDYYFFGLGVKTQFQRQVGSTSLYRAGEIYSAYYPSSGLDQEGFSFGQPDSHFAFEVREDGMVVDYYFATGIMWPDRGNTEYVHPSYFQNFQDESNWVANVQIADGVYQFAPVIYWEGVGGIADYIFDPLLLIALDGANFGDTSLKMEYLGSHVSPDQKTTSALVSITPGVDAAEFKYAITEGNLLDEANAQAFSDFVNGIHSGAIESEVSKEALVASFALNKMGLYTVAAVSYYPDGSVGSYNAVSFAFSPADSQLPVPETSLEVLLDESGNYDPASSILFRYKATNVTSAYVMCEFPENLELYGIEGEEALAEWVKTYGMSFDEVFEDLTSEEGFAGIFQGLFDNTEYMIITYAENEYGMTDLKMETITTASTSTPEWKSLGMGTFADRFAFAYQDGSYPVFEVEIMQSTTAEVPTYRVMFPYHQGLLMAYYPVSGGRGCDYIEFSVVDDLVEYTVFATGLFLEDGKPETMMYMFYGPGTFQGYDDYAQYCNVVKDGVFHLAGLYVDSTYYGYDNAATWTVEIVLPGVDYYEQAAAVAKKQRTTVSGREFVKPAVEESKVKIAPAKKSYKSTKMSRALASQSEIQPMTLVR